MDQTIKATTIEAATIDEADRAAARVSAALVFFRTVGALSIAAIACAVPQVGPYRFWLAAILVFLFVPFALWLEHRFPVADNGWSEPLFDLITLVLLVHLVPDQWFTALVIGLMVVQAPSVADNSQSPVFYGLFALILTVGMTFAAVVHDVEGWGLPILAMVVLYPSVIFYSQWQATRQNEIRGRAKALEGFHQLAGGVAHDFNNILTTVVGEAEAARSQLPPGHEARASMNEVVDAANRASLLSAHLLAFSGRNLPPDELLCLEDEIRDLVALMQPMVPKGISVELHSALAGERVKSDRFQLQQLVMNLIMNACEATQVLPGRVAIALDLEDDMRSGRAWIRLSVVDRGVGIPTEKQPKIFDPFFTSKEQGHGLGLASVRETVREIGGQIEVRSVEGEGTDVQILFPAHPAKVAEPASSSTPSLRRGGKVLVIDDDIAVRSTVSRLLEHLDYQILETGEPSRALALFEEHEREIDAVLLDLRMPEMDGWQCFEAIRAIRADTPIIICSGFDPGEADQHENDPRLAFLAKPFRLASLRSALDRVMQPGIGGTDDGAGPSAPADVLPRGATAPPTGGHA